MSDAVKVIFWPSGETVYLDAGALARSLAMSDISFKQDCGGLGICGSCKIRIVKNTPKPTEGEIVLLTEKEIKEGYRLGCSTITNGGEVIEIETEGKGNDYHKLDESIKVIELDPWSDNDLALAIDLGSTNIVGHVMNCSSGDLVTSFSLANGQASIGADVMTRLAYASQGGQEARERLKQTTLDDISSLVKNLEHTRIKFSDVVAVMNSAMELFLLGHDPDSLGKYPYKSNIEGPAHIKLFENDTPLGGATFHIPTNIGGYVGSDTVAALVAIEAGSAPPKIPYAIMDLGTNAEIALVTDKGITACSTAAGPAFEGGGISCGMRGINGAIAKVVIRESEIRCSVIGEEGAKGITGSGIFSVIGELLRIGALDGFGMFQKKNIPAGALVESDGEKKLLLENDVYISEHDIQQFMLAKAATRAGLDTIMEVCGVTLDQLENIYICGVFANKVDSHDIVSVGLTPVDENKIVMAGNTAGAGVAMMACSKKMFEYACDLGKTAEHLRLSGHESFNHRFTIGVRF